MPGNPFQFADLPRSPIGRAAVVAARPFLTWLLRLRTYEALYARTQSGAAGPFEARALEALDIRVTCTPDMLEPVPRRGALLVVANHPHGVVDGLALATTLRRVRPDVRIVTNHWLSRIPDLADLCFFVDPFGGPAAQARSRAGLRSAHLWLRQGGALILFPAGEVAHTRTDDGSYADSPWHSTAGRLALTTGASVLPAFIAGRNTPLFYAAGRLHPVLRTALLARELLSARGRTVQIRIGAPLGPPGSVEAWSTSEAATEHMRSAVERLARPSGGTTVERAPANAIAVEIDALPPEACLIESGEFRVFCTEASRIPTVLREIGRLREVTYRAVGEGTGQPLDLDAFDDRYLHLFSWDRHRRQIVGAYRIGRTDQIVAAHGTSGLYTRTLFRYDERLVSRLSPALELGRSFVRAEYQKNYNALLLLWKGIGQFIVRHPQYRILLGPVSISARYSDHSQELLMAFLEQNHVDQDLAGLVEAVHPSPAKRGSPLHTAVPRSVDDVNRAVAHAEADGKGMPVLLRQYLKLNAKAIGFSVDPHFGDALDALMMVDLTAVDPAILARYLGRQGAQAFLAWHCRGASAHAA
jgi:putative hemolysin